MDESDPDFQWLAPELFDPATPGSNYFLSTPPELFRLAADALDPEGETELGKWRRSE